MSWVILFFAIVFEVAGTLTLKFTEGMTRLWPTVLMFAFTWSVSSASRWRFPKSSRHRLRGRVRIGDADDGVMGAFSLIFILPAAARVVK